MEVQERVHVNTGALMGWVRFSEAQRQYVLDRLAHLASQPPEQWSQLQVVPIEHVPSVYLLLGPDDYRVTFRREVDGRFTILDIVLQEFLDRYFEGGPARAGKS
jgi:hypothetical protein